MTQPHHGTLCLLVLEGGGSLSTQNLPAQGEVTIGSDPTAELRFEDPSLVARHARLRIGTEVTVESLGDGSVLVQGNPLPRGSLATLHPGDLLRLGEMSFVLQKRATARPRRIWTHGYFEARLDEECVRATRSNGQFTLLRIRVAPSTPATLVEDVLANVLRHLDILGAYGPGDHEVLLLDTPPSGSLQVQSRLSREFNQRGVDAAFGLAHFPNDGQSPDRLIAVAAERLTGEDDAPVNDSASEPTLDGASIDAPLPFEQVLERIAASDISVLLLGETGVGKERLAEKIHRLSPRGNQPCLRLNCAALSENLLESELFVHERGSFTGAHALKVGLLETAGGGTVLLDEVGEMPLAIQAKLLRVMEERQFRRVGGVKPIQIDVRFVSATNRDLEFEIQRGAFRQDLYFRLNGASVVIPPLRERRNEIPALCRNFIADACHRLNRPGPLPFSTAAEELIQSYSWPGNIRELRNVIERAVILCSEPEIGLAHLPVEKMSATVAWRRPPGEPPPASLPPVPTAIKDPGFAVGRTQEIEAYERQRIEEALTACAGNQTEASKRLGISRRTLVNRLTRYDLPRPRKKSSHASSDS